MHPGRPELYKTEMKKNGYQKEIDGLRAVAIISVVLFHAFPKVFPGGFVGVDIFFVISGYLITGKIISAIDKSSFSFLDFYHRRILRIFPLALVVIVSCFLFGLFVLLPNEFQSLGLHSTASILFVQNIILFYESGYFDMASIYKPLLHFWSLAVEEQFYLFWPCFLLFFFRIFRSVILGVFIVVLLSFYVSLFYSKVYSDFAFYLPFTRIWEFGFGALLVLAISRRSFFNIDVSKKDKNNIVRIILHIKENKLYLNLLALIALFVIGFSIIFLNKFDPFPYWYALVPTAAAVVIISIGPNSIVTERVLGNPVPVSLGLVSYSLYLWHWPILSYLEIIEGDTPHRDARILAIVVSFVLAIVTTRFIETPVRTYGKSRPWVSIFLVGIALVLSASSFYLSTATFVKDRPAESLPFRKGLEHKIGHSFAFFEGKDHWLFLGNAWDDVVAKLKLAREPSQSEIDGLLRPFIELAASAGEVGAKVVVVVGPNKSSIYPEKLPDQLTVSPRRYLSFFEQNFSDVDNLTFYDPTNDLLGFKKDNKLLYSRTDSHWNSLGAYIAYRQLMQRLGLSGMKYEFVSDESRAGDIVELSGLEHFPIMTGDTWVARPEQAEKNVEFPVEKTRETTFGTSLFTVNNRAPINKVVWVLGDSFTKELRPYLSSSFLEVQFLGHWGLGNLATLADELVNAANPPDIILVVRAERFF
jgi:peptidoglycan/LPS O-acetylase OafA/YrhL